MELVGEEVLRPLGSGYFVRSNRVLTAAHVLDGVGGLGVLRVGDAKGALPAKRLWPSGPATLDLAVLEVEVSSGAPGPEPALAWGRLPQTGQWKAAGFPLAGDAVGGIGFGGDDYGHGLNEQLLQLQVRLAPGKPELWGGASGAAVFANGLLVGVVVSQIPDFAGRILLATPLYEANAETDFLLALGVGEERIRRRDRLLQQISELLAANEVAAQELADARAGEPLYAQDWRAFLSPDFNPRGLAEHLCEAATLGEVFEAFNRAHHAVVPAAGSRRVRLSRQQAFVAEALEDLLAIIAPVVFATSVVIPLPSGRGGLIQLPVSTETLAEIALAGLEGRNYSFEPLDSESNFPDPRAWLRLPEKRDERGLDLGQTKRLWMLVKQNEDLVPVQDLGRIPKQAPASIAELKKPLGTFDTALSIHAQRLTNPLRRFVLLSDLSDASDRAFLELLQEHLPALRIVHATATDIDGERRLCAPLQEFHLRAHRARRSRP